MKRVKASVKEVAYAAKTAIQTSNESERQNAVRRLRLLLPKVLQNCERTGSEISTMCKVLETLILQTNTFEGVHGSGAPGIVSFLVPLLALDGGAIDTEQVRHTLETYFNFVVSVDLFSATAIFNDMCVLLNDAHAITCTTAAANAAPTSKPLPSALHHPCSC